MTDMKEMVDMRKWLSVGEAARELGVAPVTVVRWCDAGKIEFRKTMGGHRRIHVDTIEAIINQEGDHP